MQALSRHQDRTRRVSDPAHTLEVTGVRSEDPACTRILWEAMARQPPPLVSAYDLKITISKILIIWDVITHHPQYLMQKGHIFTIPSSSAPTSRSPAAR